MKLVEHPSQLWTTSSRARNLLLIDPLAADVLERRVLPGEVLILGGDAGVADEHGGTASLQRSSRNILFCERLLQRRNVAFRPCPVVVAKGEFRELEDDEPDIPECWTLTPADQTLVMAK